MSNIKIQDVNQRIQYTATSGQTEFTIPFPFFENSDIVAYQDSTLLVLTTDYTLSGADSPSGGTLTLVSGATTGDIITILGDTPIDRTSIYSATISNLTGSDLNQDFNREVVMMKQLETTQDLLQVQYAPYAEVSQDVSVTKDRWLPRLDPNHTWAMNADGDEIIAYDITATGGLVNIVDGTTNQIDVDSTDPTEPVLSLSSTLVLPGTMTAGGAVNMNSNKINNVTDPTSAQDAATKAYVDSTASGLVDSVTGTANQVNAGGTAADPVLSLSSTIQFPGTTGYSTGNGILDENSNEQLMFTTTASAVNYLDVTNAATGSGPLLQAAGSDTDVDLRIQAKGAGNVLFDGSDVIFGDPGTEESGIDVGGVTYNSNVKSSEIGSSNVAQFIMHRHSTTLQPLILGARSNSDTSGHAPVSAGQSMLTAYAAGWTGAEYNFVGAIDFSVDTTGTISDASSPGRVRFQVTADGATAPTTAVTISNDKTVTFAGDIDASMTDGQLLIGNTGSPLSKATLTAGTGISVANTAGAITISATGGGFGVATISGTTQSAAVNTMYIALNAGQTTVTLPGTYSVGDTVSVVGSTANTGGWVLTAASGDTIIYNGVTTSAGGTLTSSALAGQTIEVVCDVANTSWVVVDTVNTSITTA